jgi:hypothetical protein
VVKHNQNGLGTLEVIIALVIIAMMGGISIFLYDRLTLPFPETDAPKTSVTPAAAEEKPEYTVPDGYAEFTSKEFGFKFAYPEVYKGISDAALVYGVTVYESGSPAASYAPGITGMFKVYVRPAADEAITSRKYGPKIRLQNGKWIVTEVNEADPAKNKAGEEYKDLDGKALAYQANGNLSVYTLKSADEGSIIYTLVFVSGDKLVEILLPSFSDGLYANSDDNATPNDESKYTELLKNVRDSIGLLE